MRGWTRRNKSRIRGYHLKYQYGITHEEYDRLVAAQHGVCAICGQPPSGRTIKDRRLAVDHDHLTGMVRGILCRPCNLIIGFIDDDEWLERARAYLQMGRRPQKDGRSGPPPASPEERA